MPLLWRPHADRRSLRARRHAARSARRCRERDLSHDYPECLVAASNRRNFSRPAPCPFHSRTGKRRHDIADHSSIMPSATPAQSGPQSSPASSSHQSAQNDLPPAPPRDQIPIAGQLLSRCPAGSFFGGFRTLAPYPGSTARAGPASETLTVSGLLSARRWLGLIRPNRLSGAPGQPEFLLFGRNARRCC